jgi:N6-L-threonylcarbamoyladenine synthase
VNLKRSEEFPDARLLAIESSCDETAAAIVENGRLIHSNIVASQVDLHAEYGGVFPELASRQHVQWIYPVVEAALQKAHLSLLDVDALAVTRGPGLAGSLVVGMNMAKGISLASGLPLIGINHLEGHIYSSWLYEDTENNPAIPPKFPLLALVVSGGHTELILIEDHLVYKRLGKTLDDAAGEAFDKVARLLSLPYPGGPSIQIAAMNGDPGTYNFPRAKLEGTWNFSFSGVKTAVLREIKKYEQQGESYSVEDMAASFQFAVVDILVEKTIMASKEYKAKQILIAGGVSANQLLRNSMMSRSTIPVNIPPIHFCTDNAAMIGAAGYFRFIKGYQDSLDMDVLPNWTLI